MVSLSLWKFHKSAKSYNLNLPQKSVFNSLHQEEEGTSENAIKMANRILVPVQERLLAYQMRYNNFK